MGVFIVIIKVTFSTVWIEIYDAHYALTFIDIGIYGSNNDNSIF